MATASPGNAAVAKLIRKAVSSALPGADPAAVDTFARDNANSHHARLTKALNIFVETILPDIPQATSHGWKLHVRVPLRTFNEDDRAEQHACVAEAAVLAAMNPLEANKYCIDVVENKELRLNFMSMKHNMVAIGKDPAELLLFHGTQGGNLDAILSGNFDPKCIRRVAYGHGFYFSEYPATSLGYGSSLILCRILPGKTQTDGPQFLPQRFDSFQLGDGVEYAEGAARNIHVVKERNQILPICVVHTQTLGYGQPPATNLNQGSHKYRLERFDDFSHFDEDNKAQMSARRVLCRMLRMNQGVPGLPLNIGMPWLNPPAPAKNALNRGHVISSVVYVENEEAKYTFQAMKCQLAEDNRDNNEVLLFHHATVWRPSFFSENEFDCDLIKSAEFGPGFQLTDWLKLGSSYINIVVVYRVLLGKIQEGPQWDQQEYNSMRLQNDALANQVDHMTGNTQYCYTYLVQNKYQLLPYCVVLIKNEDAKDKIVTRIMKKVEQHLTPQANFAEEQTEDPTCLVCERINENLMEWFGCPSSCGLCADFFRRICIGSNYFVMPEECEAHYRCIDVVTCCGCRLRKCLECGMTAEALASRFDLSEAHQTEVDAQLDDFLAKVMAVLKLSERPHYNGHNDLPVGAAEDYEWNPTPVSSAANQVARAPPVMPSKAPFNQWNNMPIPTAAAAFAPPPVTSAPFNQWNPQPVPKAPPKKRTRKPASTSASNQMNNLPISATAVSNQWNQMVPVSAAASKQLACVPISKLLPNQYNSQPIATVATSSLQWDPLPMANQWNPLPVSSSLSKQVADVPISLSSFKQWNPLPLSAAAAPNQWNPLPVSSSLPKQTTYVPISSADQWTPLPSSSKPYNQLSNPVMSCNQWNPLPVTLASSSQLNHVPQLAFNQWNPLPISVPSANQWDLPSTSCSSSNQWNPLKTSASSLNQWQPISAASTNQSNPRASSTVTSNQWSLQPATSSSPNQLIASLSSTHWNPKPSSTVDSKQWYPLASSTVTSNQLDQLPVTFSPSTTLAQVSISTSSPNQWNPLPISTTSSNQWNPKPSSTADSKQWYPSASSTVTSNQLHQEPAPTSTMLAHLLISTPSQWDPLPISTSSTQWDPQASSTVTSNQWDSPQSSSSSSNRVAEVPTLALSLDQWNPLPLLPPSSNQLDSNKDNEEDIDVSILTPTEE